MSSLEERLQDYYAEQQPGPAFQEALTGQLARRRKLRQQGLFAAAALLFLSLFLLAPLLGDRRMEQRVAQELATQFHKNDPRPFQALSEWSQLPERLPALQFAPLAFPSEAFAGWQPRGARYCSVQGQQAAQIRMQHASGEEALLYVTQRQGGLQRLQAGSSERKGLSITRQPQEEQIFLLVCPAPES